MRAPLLRLPEQQALKIATELDRWALPREKVLAQLDVEGARQARSLAKEVRRVADMVRAGREQDDLDTVEAGLDVLHELRVFASELLGEEAVGLAADAESLPPPDVETVRPPPPRAGLRMAGRSSPPPRRNTPPVALGRVRLRQTHRPFPAVRPPTDPRNDGGGES